MRNYRKPVALFIILVGLYFLCVGIVRVSHGAEPLAKAGVKVDVANRGNNHGHHGGGHHNGNAHHGQNHHNNHGYHNNRPNYNYNRGNYGYNRNYYSYPYQYRNYNNRPYRPVYPYTPVRPYVVPVPVPVPYGVQWQASTANDAQLYVVFLKDQAQTQPFWVDKVFLDQQSALVYAGRTGLPHRIKAVAAYYHRSTAHGLEVRFQDLHGKWVQSIVAPGVFVPQ